MATTPNNVKTLVVDKFNGRLTRYRDGDINSGMANYYASYGFDCFIFSGTLFFNQAPIDITKSVITDMVMAGKVRVESGITYVYAIGHQRRLYKIQVNNLTTKNPDYDTPVLLATLGNSQTFLYGGSLDFFEGSSEKIWIGHDAGVTKINFDGTGETNLIGGSWVSNVPRQQVQFLGSLFFTNGDNLAKISTSETVSTYEALSPGFPANTQARDIDLTADGRYVVATVTRNLLSDMTAVTPDTNSIASMPSLLVYWNGTDTAASSSTSFPGFALTAYQTFSKYEYLFGYQIGGAMWGTPNEVIGVSEFSYPPYPNAVAASGDFLGWYSMKWINGQLQAVGYIYGTIDKETPVGLYQQFQMESTLDDGDVIRVPFLTTVSNWEPGGLTSGYTANAPFNTYGTGKSYFSTLEYDGTTTRYGFYMYKNVNDLLGASGTGVYETQHQVFSKKIKPTEVRVYLEPPSVPAICAFSIDLIGISSGIFSSGALTGGSFTFTSSNQLSTTSDVVKYTPQTGGTAVLGLRVSNVGALSPLIHRVEIDYTPYGD
jgi:hypothetical protein